MGVKDYRISLRPEAVFACPVRGDLLAGHLCWFLARTEGAGAVRVLRQAAEGGAFRLSDALPRDFLPLPVDDPALCADEWAAAEEEFRGACRPAGRLRVPAATAWHALAMRARQLRGVRIGFWQAALSRPALLRALIAGRLAGRALAPSLWLPWQIAPSETSPTGQPWCSLHRTVDRVSGGARRGALHARVGVAYPPDCELDLYLRCEEHAVNHYCAALTQIGLDGHLKHASTGWGRFSLGWPELWSWPLTEPDPHRWVTLSPCVPEEDYSGTAFYHVLTHYGRLGGNARGGVFKQPVLLLATGAAFHGPPPRGRWLTGVHPQHAEVMHYAFAYPVAC